MIGQYSAARIDNGERVEGNLIYQKGSSVAYILTKENYEHMIVNELNNGKTACNLICVRVSSIQPC